MKLAILSSLVLLGASSTGVHGHATGSRSGMHARRALDLSAGHAIHHRRNAVDILDELPSRMMKQRRQPLASPGMGAIPVMSDGNAQIVGLTKRDAASLGSHNGEEGSAYRGSLATASTSSSSSGSSSDSGDSSDSSDSTSTDDDEDEDCEEEDDDEDEEEDCEEEDDDGEDDDEDCEEEEDEDSPSSTSSDDASGTTSASGASGSSTSSSSDDTTCEADEDDDSSSSSSTSSSSSSSSSSDSSSNVNVNIKVGSSSNNSNDSSSSSSSATASSTSKSSSSGTKTSSAAQYQGTATWFLQNGNAGNCGNKNPDSAKVIALYTSLYGNGKYCGKQVKIENLDDGTSTIATVADSCPSCGNENNIDLSVGAFQAIDPEYKQHGVRNIKWSFID